MSVERDFALPDRQALAGGDADLFLHDVDAGHELGHRVLDLETRVRLHEVEPRLVVHEELERAGVGVLHGLRGVHDEVPQLAPLFLRERRRRRLFEQLLMAPLDRALALAEMHHGAVMIAHHLHLDMARVLEIFLDVDVGHAERGLGLALRGPDRVSELLRRCGRRACRGRRRRRSP